MLKLSLRQEEERKYLNRKIHTPGRPGSTQLSRGDFI